MSGCFECGGPLGRGNGKLVVFFAGLSGHRSSCHLCPACHAEVQRRGGPGPNASRASLDAANAAVNAARSAPFVPGTRGSW
jgi:hypothetical protein